MSTTLLILLLGAVPWSATHVFYGKEPGRHRNGIRWNRRMIGRYHGRNMPYSYPPRYYSKVWKLTRHPYEEWRPVREAPAFGRHVVHSPTPRYPVFHNSKGYSYPSSKRILNQPLAENSDTVEVFSPAPPSILGSLSVFGHATVNAREPASHITKKSPRPQYTADYPQYERPKLNNYNVWNQFGPQNQYPQNDYSKKPNRYTDYNDPYFPDSTLRPPPRESLKKVSSYSPMAQSTSLSPNSFFYDQPQPFQPSAPDHSFEKVRQPINSYHFTSTAGYSTPVPLDYRTTINDYDQATNSFYKPVSNKGSHVSSSWNRNPFGDISLSTRRPDVYVKPVVEEKEPVKDLYNQYSHLGRPFRNPDYTTTVNSHRDVETYSPFVTTFPSPPDQHNVKFSDVAHPFHVRNDFRHHNPTGGKSEYAVTQNTYNQDVYPITVTSVDALTEPARDLMKKHNDINKDELYLPEVVSRPFSKNKNNYEPNSEKRPQVQITSYQGYKEKSPSTPFLPTPTPDVRPYAPQPTIDEETTDQPEVSSNAQDYNYISTIDNQYHGMNDGITDYPAMTTTLLVETTTTPPPKTKPTLKSRRRPTRPSHTSKHPDGSKYKNHRVPDDEYSTTVDYYKSQRRRKPSNKYRDNSEFKRYRTTTTSTTTTSQPPIEDATDIFIEDTTIIAEAPKAQDQDIMIDNRHQGGGLNNFDNYYSSFSADRISPVENVFSSQSPERDIFNLNYADIFSETTSPSTTTTSSTTPATTSTTTTTTTTAAPVSVTTPTQENSSISTRLKNKYGNNRPRFSIKEYRDRLNRGSSTTSAPNKDDETTTLRPKNDIPKILSRMRPSQHQRSTTEAPINSQDDETTPEPKYRKYKPRLGPSRTFYKTSTTAAPELVDTTTTERINTFRPSTNRYKPGTGKYYSRYRTSSLSPKEVDDSPVTTTAKITIKPKGVFSAKRRPNPMKNRPEVTKDDEGSESSEEMPSTPNFGDTLKLNDNEVIPAVPTKKIDDGKTIITGGDDKLTEISSNDKTPLNVIPQHNVPPTGNEAMRVADLTSSSSNDFHSSNIFKTNIISNRRILPKITLPTEEPILPLEAFFQTRHNN